MTLAEDLLIQAKHLALVDTCKPKQANLRRAVSATYYALFHLLVDDGAASIGSRLSSLGKAKVRRAFVHADMKVVCAQYAMANNTSSLHPQIAPLLTFPISPELKHVANIFLHLQKARHLADYNTSCKFNRMGVLSLIEATALAFNDWKYTRLTSNAQVFLIDLVLRKFWSRP